MIASLPWDLRSPSSLPSAAVAVRAGEYRDHWRHLRGQNLGFCARAGINGHVQEP